jgi:hypothetical protein
MPVLYDQDVTTKIPVGGPNQFLDQTTYQLKQSSFSKRCYSYKLI